MSRKTAEQRKAEMVEIALDLSYRLGPDRWTTSDIAQAVGLSQAAVFKHFPRKADIWQAVAESLAGRLESQWQAALDQGGTPSERLERLVSAQLSTIHATPAIPAILFSRELHNDNEPLRQYFLGLVERFGGLLGKLVQEAQAAGQIKTDEPAKDVALLIMGLVQGLALRWSLSGRTFDIEKEGERLLGMMLRGLR